MGETVPLEQMPDSPDHAPVIAASSPGECQDERNRPPHREAPRDADGALRRPGRAGTSPARQAGPSNETDARLTAALAEANERMLRYSEDATRSHGDDESRG